MGMSKTERLCKDCGVPLTTENWYSSDMKMHKCICKSCCCTRAREWRKTHPKQSRETERRYYALYHDKCVALRKKYRRKRVVKTLDGRTLLGNKRPYPEDECCELCNRRRRLLAYHHYNDYDLQEGLWLCPPCHLFAEGVDRGFVNPYFILKEKVIKTRGGLPHREMISFLSDKVADTETERERVFNLIMEATKT